MPARPEKSAHTVWMVAGFLLVCAVAVVVSRLNDRVTFQQKALSPSVFAVKAGSLSSFSFSVYKDGRVLGRFQTANGNDPAVVNDGVADAESMIVAVILDARDFENWKNGRPAPALYRSERTQRGGFDIALPPGQYFLAFDNRFSPLTDKKITASVILDQRNSR